jgi:hypothetical protein
MMMQVMARFSFYFWSQGLAMYLSTHDLLRQPPERWDYRHAPPWSQLWGDGFLVRLLNRKQGGL